MIRAFLAPYVLPAALTAAVALCGALGVQTWRVGNLQDAKAVLERDLAASERRVTSLEQARDRRNEIESLSDDDLRDELSRRVRDGN